jgi:hypothetical protein
MHLSYDHFAMKNTTDFGIDTASEAAIAAAIHLSCGHFAMKNINFTFDHCAIKHNRLWYRHGQ